EAPLTGPANTKLAALAGKVTAKVPEVVIGEPETARRVEGTDIATDLTVPSPTADFDTQFGLPDASVVNTRLLPAPAPKRSGLNIPVEIFEVSNAGISAATMERKVGAPAAPVDGP